MNTEPMILLGRVILVMFALFGMTGMAASVYMVRLALTEFRGLDRVVSFGIGILTGLAGSVLALFAGITVFHP